MTQMKFKPAVAVLALTLLSGCGVAAKINAREQYQSSANAYKACLIANPSYTSKCEGYRLAMETDQHQYTDFSAGMTPGASRAANVTLFNR
jgi:hypothetical protein